MLFVIMYTVQQLDGQLLAALAEQATQMCSICKQIAHLKWTLGLTAWTCANLDLIFSVLEERSHNKAAPGAVEFNHLQLRENACSSRHHTLEPDQ